MAHVIVIPAREASERFPGKLLRDDTGWPLIRHVHERCLSVEGVDRVVVAVDGEPLRTAVESFGGEAVVTDPDLPTGTDRVAEAVRALQLDHEQDLVVNVQGDEPEIDPRYVALLFARLEESRGSVGASGEASDRKTDDGAPPRFGVATLITRRSDPEGWHDPNRVKVVRSQQGEGLYFSRAPVPRPRDGTAPPEWWLHLGVYGFLPGALARFQEARVRGEAPSPLEAMERLEQLRFLEMGIGIAVDEVAEGVGGIDTEADYHAFLARWRASR